MPGWATEFVHPAVWRGKLDVEAAELVEAVDKTAHNRTRGYRDFSFDLSRLDYSETTLVAWSYTQLIGKLRPHFKGEMAWLRSKSDADVVRWLSSDIMLLQAGIVGEVSKKWSALSLGDDCIGVHIRFMDRRTTIESFYRALDRLLVVAPKSQIFLATDNKDVQKAVMSRYKNVIHNEKWFPDDSQSMHRSHECPDRLQNAIDALVDMYMLAKCNSLIYPGSSTFSLMSSLISKAPRAHIVDVERSDPVIQLKKTVK